MKTNFFTKLPRVLFIISTAVLITVFISGCSVFKGSSKNPDDGNKIKKENTKKKPPIKRNLCE